MVTRQQRRYAERMERKATRQPMPPAEDQPSAHQAPRPLGRAERRQHERAARRGNPVARATATWGSLEEALSVDPHPVYRELQRRTPVIKDPKTGHWMFTRYHDILTLFRGEHVIMPTGRAGGHAGGGYPADWEARRQRTVEFLNGPAHTARRRAWVAMFPRPDALHPVAATAARAALDDAIATGAPPLDLMPVVRRAAAAVMAAFVVEHNPTALFSEGSFSALSDAHRAWFIEHLLKFYDPEGHQPGADPARGRAEAHAFVKFLMQHILLPAGATQERLDALCATLTPDDDTGLNVGRVDIYADEIVVQMMEFLAAGGRFVPAAAGNVLYALLCHPTELRRVRDDPALLPAAIDEGLRWESPIGMGLHRMTRANVKVGGCNIRAGELVSLVTDAANRDPAVFPDPDRFDIERRCAPSLTFEAEPHSCPAAGIVRAVIAGMVGEVLTQLPTTLRLAVSPAELRWDRNPALRGLMALPVTW